MRFSRRGFIAVWLPMVLGLITGALFLVPAIVYQPYSLINHDTYQYIAIAAGYLYNPQEIFQRDAYTLGPALPLMIAGLKALARLVGPDSIAKDVAIVKALVVMCYIGICGAFIHLSGIRRASVAMATAAVFLAFLPREVDSLSLNGELVCSTLIIAVMLLLEGTPGTKRVVIAAIVSVIIVYTKLQAVPVLTVVAVYYFLQLDSGRRKLFGLTAFAVLVILEALFVSQGGGFTRRVYDLLMYSGYPAKAGAQGNLYFPLRLAGRMTRYFYWAIAEMVRVFPIFLAALFLLLTRFGKPRGLQNRYLLALLVATIFSILFSGYLFGHYALLGLPFIAAALACVRPSFGIESSRVGISAIAFIGLLAASRLADVALEPGLPRGLRPRPLPTWGNEALAAEVRKRIPAGTKPDLLVHGWDFAWYSGLGKASPEITLALVNIGRLTADQYADSVLSKKFPYVLDITGRSGLLTGPEYGLGVGSVYYRRLAAVYRPVWSAEGVQLYQRTVP